MQLTLTELKARFATTDKPSAKDFGDLIDTIAGLKTTTIGPGSVTLSMMAQPFGTANEFVQTDSSGNMIVAGFTMPAVTSPDDSLVGTYPALSVASDPSLDSSRGISGNHIKSGSLTIRHLSTAEANLVGAGAVLQYNGTGFAWVISGAAGTTSTVAYQLLGARAAVSYGGSLYAAHVLRTAQTAAGDPTASTPKPGFGSTPVACISELTQINYSNNMINIGANVTSNPFPTSDNPGTNTFGTAQLNVVRWPTLGKDALMWIRSADLFMPLHGVLSHTAQVDAVVNTSGNGPVRGQVSGGGAYNFLFNGLEYSNKFNPGNGAGNISGVFVSDMTPTYNTYGAAPTFGTQANVADIWGTVISGGAGGTAVIPIVSTWAIVQVDDTGSTSTPDMYVLASQYFPLPTQGYQCLMTNCSFGKLSYSGSAYAFTGNIAGDAGTPPLAPANGINFLNSSIATGSNGSIAQRQADIFSQHITGGAPLLNNPVYILMARYNPVKKRFYVIDSLTGMLHIYDLSVTLASWIGAGSSALDYTKLTYKGSFVIPDSAASYESAMMGTQVYSGGYYYTPSTIAGEASMRTHWTLEFDLATGAEKALCVTHGMNNKVVRLPWLWTI